jgi:indolepyruvate ferredoxin oxidoreductase beta subunit
MSCDLVLIGVGGQGILTIGEILLEAALDVGLGASFLPTKGMAQRGGFVVAELRLGESGGGPRVAEGTAALVISMERSEALKGIRYVRPGGIFFLYDHVWAPTGVLLGRDAYPAYGDVMAQIEASGAELRTLRPESRPTIGNRPVAANIYVLGAVMASPAMEPMLAADAVEEAIARRWPRAADSNRTAFRAGLSTDGSSTGDRGKR